MSCRSGLGTGVAAASRSPGQRQSISASVTDLACCRSENENASGDPQYRDRTGPHVLLAVQVTEGDVAEAGEHRDGRVRDAADPDVPLDSVGAAPVTNACAATTVRLMPR